MGYLQKDENIVFSIFGVILNNLAVYPGHYFAGILLVMCIVYRILLYKKCKKPSNNFLEDEGTVLSVQQEDLA